MAISIIALNIIALAIFSADARADCPPGFVQTSDGRCMEAGRVDCGVYSCPAGQRCVAGGKCTSPKGTRGSCEPGAVKNPFSSHCYNPKIGYLCGGEVCIIGQKYSPGEPCAACAGAANRPTPSGLAAAERGYQRKAEQPQNRSLSLKRLYGMANIEIIRIPRPEREPIREALRRHWWDWIPNDSARTYAKVNIETADDTNGLFNAIRTDLRERGELGPNTERALNSFETNLKQRIIRELRKHLHLHSG